MCVCVGVCVGLCTMYTKAYSMELPDEVLSNMVRFLGEPDHSDRDGIRNESFRTVARLRLASSFFTRWFDRWVRLVLDPTLLARREL